MLYIASTPHLQYTMAGGSLGKAKDDDPDFTTGLIAALTDDQVAKRLKDVITTDIKSEITGLKKIIEKKENRIEDLETTVAQLRNEQDSLEQ